MVRLGLECDQFTVRFVKKSVHDKGSHIGIFHLTPLCICKN